MELDNLNAPQFVDFTKPLDDDSEDSYFEFDHEGEGGLIPNSFSGSLSNEIEDKENKQAGFDASCEDDGEKACKAAKKNGVLRNVCKSIDEWRKKAKPTADAVKKKLSRQNPRLVSAPKEDQNNVDSLATSRQEKLTRKSPKAREAKIKRTSNPESSASQLPVKRSRTRSMERVAPRKSLTSSLSRSSSFRSIPRRVPRRDFEPRLVPAPTETATKQPNSKLLSSTEQQLQEAQSFKKKLAQNRKQHEKFRLKAMTATVVPKVMGKPPTKPEEFHFKTDDRVKTHGMETRQDQSEHKDFNRMLRSHEHSPRRATPQKTKVQPFTFDRKRKKSGDSNCSESGGFHSMAEMVQKFTSQTPERFRRKGNNREASPSKRRRRSVSQPHLTLPKTPNLSTRTRSRPQHVKSQQQIDEEELQEHHKQQFRAHPLNEKILEKVVGVKRVPSRPLTQPATPDLELRRRAANWRAPTPEEKYEFHANPVPKNIFDGPTGIKPAPQMKLTVPASPAFCTRNRVTNILRSTDTSTSSTEDLPQSKPAPKFGVPFKPKLDSKVTEFKPFSFDERVKTMQQRKEEKLQKLTEEQIKVKEFHANPIPDLSPELPPRVVREPTRPKPFQLEIDARGQTRAEEWSQKVKEEMKQAREQALFKAKPSTILQKEPFVPKKSNKPLTDVNDVHLYTERRVEERHRWEQWRQEKEQELSEAERQRDALREQQEREQERIMRQQAVTRAQPIRKYREVAIKASDKPLTQPHSPHFHERPPRRRSSKQD